MKKLVLIVIATTTLTSCATVFGGRINQQQRERPAVDQPKRQVRVVPLVVNILMFPYGLIGLAIDFGTGAAYKPTPNK